MRFSLLIITLLLHFSPLLAQSIGVGYYDLDKLYNTSEALFYNDSQYTPEGTMQWSQERYDRKIRNTAALIDSMSLPIMGLYGVENQAVLHDVIMSCQTDYSSIHRTRNSLDGLDFALLYFGDKLYVESVEALRNSLVVSGILLANQTPITIILTRNGRDTIEYLEEESHTELVIVMGKIYSSEIRKMGYTHLLKEQERHGQGNYRITRGYVMHDRIATNQKEKILKSGVYIAPWLLTPDLQAPLPTYDKVSYKGGYSKYLPIFTYIIQ